MDNQTITGFALLFPLLNTRACIRLISTCKSLHIRYSALFLAKRREEKLKHREELKTRLSYLYLKNKLGKERKAMRAEMAPGFLHIKILPGDGKRWIDLIDKEMIHGMTIIYKEQPSGQVRISNQTNVILAYNIQSTKLDDNCYVYSIPHFLYGNPLVVREFFSLAKIESTNTPIHKVIYLYSIIPKDWYIPQALHRSYLYDSYGFNLYINQHGTSGLYYSQGKKTLKELTLKA